MDKNHNANNWALDILLPPKFQIERTMKWEFDIKRIFSFSNIVLFVCVVLFLLGIVSFLVICFNESYHFNSQESIDSDLASKLGDFLGGFVGTIFSALSVSLIIYTFHEQSLSERKNVATNHVFKMIDSHNRMLGQMSIEDENGKVVQGGFVFDVIHCQFLRIMNSIVIPARIKIYGEISCRDPFGLLEFCDDIAYAILYYGVDNNDINDNDDNDDNSDNSAIPLVYKDWYYHALRRTKFEDNNRKEEMLEKCAFVLNEYRRENRETCEFICRSNRSFLMAYFRNVYNIVSFVDNNKDIGDDRKMLIRNFQSQLLYSKSLIWHYHLHAKIGESEWNEDLNIYVDRYDLLDGLKSRTMCKD